MPTNHEGIQAAVRARSGSTANLDWNGDWHHLWDEEEIAAGMFNERMLAWINVELAPATYTNVAEAMQAYAESLGFYNWSSMNTIGEGGAASSPEVEILWDDDDVMAWDDGDLIAWD
jgi:hypothetical protein